VAARVREPLLERARARGRGPDGGADNDRVAVAGDADRSVSGDRGKTRERLEVGAGSPAKKRVLCAVVGVSDNDRPVGGNVLSPAEEERAIRAEHDLGAPSGGPPERHAPRRVIEIRSDPGGSATRDDRAIKAAAKRITGEAPVRSAGHWGQVLAP